MASYQLGDNEEVDGSGVSSANKLHDRRDPLRYPVVQDIEQCVERLDDQCFPSMNLVRDV